MPKITDYKPLPKNPNKGTQRGVGVLDESVRKLGAGRSILVDKNGVIIAGNHAQEAFINAGMDEVIEVETDGNQIVVVKRTDMDADSIAGKKMAIMDNRAGELGLAWDDVIVEEILQDIQEQDGELDRYLKDLEFELNPEIDYDAEWAGMPEFDREPLAFRSIHVHFETQEDVDNFRELLQQNITDKTTSLWYPEKEKRNLKDIGYVDES